MDEICHFKSTQLRNQNPHHCQARKRNPNPNFLVRISSGGVGVFHVQGWGPKSFLCPSNPRETKLFWRDIPGFFAGYPGCPKSLRQKSLCSILVPYIVFNLFIFSNPWRKFQKNPRAHKNKIGTSLPSPQPKMPPLKRRILWTWRFSSRKNASFPGAHQIGAAISGPRIADTNFTDTRIFLKIQKSAEHPSSPCASSFRGCVLNLSEADFPLRTSQTCCP